MIEEYLKREIKWIENMPCLPELINTALDLIKNHSTILTPVYYTKIHGANQPNGVQSKIISIA